MIKKGSVILDPFEGCNDIGIYDKKLDDEEWAFWFKENSHMFTSMGGLTVLTPPLLGKWK